MAVSAKIVFDISNFNGNSDGSPSANDIDKIEIHKRIGPESGGGSFVVVSTITSGFSGHSTLDYEDTAIDIATPYYYKLLFYRGTDFAESNIIGPVFISGLHELGYPGNVPSDTDGVPNYIGVAPLIHISAEYEYNFYGQQEIYDYATGEYPQNVNELYPGWGLSNNHTVRVNSEGIPYINTGTSAIGAHSSNIFAMGNSGASTFNQLKTNIGAHPDSDLIAFDQGFTFAAVMLYQEFFGSKTVYQDQYFKWGLTGLSNRAMPKEWNINGSMTLDSTNYTNDAHYNHPKKISNGDYYEPSNIGNFYGPPMGVYYPNARGYWGHAGPNVGNASSSFDTRTLRTFAGITSWSRGDYMGIHRNDSTKSLSTGTFYPGGSDTNKLCTLIFRHKEDGTGTDVYVNGVLYHTSPHHQQTIVQNTGHNENNISGLDPASYPGAEGTYWSTNSHTIRYNHKQSANLLRTLYPNGAIENYEGITYHMPFILSSASVPTLLYYGSDSRLAFTELMMIPSSLSGPDFRRLTTYFGNKYGDALLPQGDYKK